MFTIAKRGEYYILRHNTLPTLLVHEGEWVPFIDTTVARNSLEPLEDVLSRGYVRFSSRFNEAD